MEARFDASILQCTYGDLDNDSREPGYRNERIDTAAWPDRSLTARLLALGEFELLDLAGRRSGELLAELDLTGVFVRREIR
jgi:hypothetical protein